MYKLIKFYFLYLTKKKDGLKTITYLNFTKVHCTKSLKLLLLNFNYLIIKLYKYIIV